MKVQAKALTSSYSNQLRGTLGIVARGLQSSLEGARAGEEKRIEGLTEQVETLDQLKDRARKLR